LRHVLILDLEDDPEAIAAYRRWHAVGAPPGAVIQSIRAAGVEQMEICLSGNRLVMVLEAGPGFSFEAKAAADAADPQVQAWETLMAQFQRPVPWAAPGEKWVLAEPIFRLTDQPA
jgi:L-rhamnose mutarotase